MGVIIRQTIKGTIINYIGVFIGFITTFFVITHLLTTEEIGLTRVLVDAGVLLAGLAQMGTGSSIIRYFPYFQNAEKKHHGFFFWTLIIPIIGFSIITLLSLLLKPQICSIFGEKSPLFVEYYYLLAPLSFFLLYLAVFETNSNVLMKIAFPKLVREVIIRLLTLVTYILYGYDLITFQQFIYAFCGVYGVAALINIIYLVTRENVSFKPQFDKIDPFVKKDVGHYSLFIITTTLITAITPGLNTFFISARLGLIFTGIFAIANYITAFIEIPYRSLGAITQPQIAKTIKDKEFKKTSFLCQQVALHQLLIGGMILWLIWINIDLIYEIMPNGSSFASGKYVVLILGISKLISSSYNVSTTVLGFSKYYYYSLLFTFVLTFSAIVLNNKLIPIWGINGAASASLISTCIFVFPLILFNQYKLKTSFFNSKQFIALLILIGLFLLNWIWELSIRSIIALLPFKTFYLSLLNGVLKSIILGLFAIIFVFKIQLSEEINKIITYILSFFTRKAQ